MYYPKLNFLLSSSKKKLDLFKRTCATSNNCGCCREFQVHVSPRMNTRTYFSWSTHANTPLRIPNVSSRRDIGPWLLSQRRCWRSLKKGCYGGSSTIGFLYCNKAGKKKTYWTVGVYVSFGGVGWTAMRLGFDWKSWLIPLRFAFNHGHDFVILRTESYLILEVLI